jgi:hypothetical protein
MIVAGCILQKRKNLRKVKGYVLKRFLLRRGTLQMFRWTTKPSGPVGGC